MTAQPLVLTFAGLGTTQSLARLHTPDDNPYSEAQFQTAEHHPTFPEHPNSVLDARASRDLFFH